jgi:syntaxin 5
MYNPIERPHSAQPYTKKPYKSDLLSLNMDDEESSIGMPSQLQQSMQLVQRQNQYLSQRGQAIESIESTIHELGSIFQQLAQMVSERAETVQRYIPRGWHGGLIR